MAGTEAGEEGVEEVEAEAKAVNLKSQRRRISLT